MPNATTSYPQTICDGGFRIEIGQDELTVTRDEAAWMPRSKSASHRVVFALFAIAVAAGLLVEVLSSPSEALYTLAVLLVLIGIGFVWMRYETISNIHCTRANLEVIRLKRGRETGRSLFPRDSVHRIQFAVDSYSSTGSTMALVFRVASKKIKVLSEIECPEAQTVLHELQRLGYDVVQDVGMPMMVEMELERRGKLRA